MFPALPHSYHQVETECLLWKYASDKPKPLKSYLDSWWKREGLGEMQRHTG